MTEVLLDNRQSHITNEDYVFRLDFLTCQYPKDGVIDDDDNRGQKVLAKYLRQAQVYSVEAGIFKQGCQFCGKAPGDQAV